MMALLHWKEELLCDKMFALMISWTSLKISHVKSETRSNFRGHIFSLVLLKEGQNVSLDDISNEFENGSCWVKN